MSRLQQLVLVLLLIAVGVEAGILVGAVLGDIPAMQRISLQNYAAYWQAVDHSMAVRMPFLGKAILLLYVVALLLFARKRSLIFWTLLGCLVINAGEIAYTVKQQLPVNHAVQALDLAHLDLAHVQQLRDATVQHFLVRVWLTVGAFVLLTFAVVSSAASAGGRADETAREV